MTRVWRGWQRAWGCWPGDGIGSDQLGRRLKRVRAGSPRLLFAALDETEGANLGSGAARTQDCEVAGPLSARRAEHDVMQTRSVFLE